MFARRRIPITAITVFGISSLLALSIGVVLFLGLKQATDTTRQLWADQSRALIDKLENSLRAHLQPLHEQALWVERDVHDLSDRAALDAYFFGVLAATPQVTGVAVITADGQSRRWMREQHTAIAEDWSQKPGMAQYLQQVKAATSATWRKPYFEVSVAKTTLLHDIALRDTSGKFIGAFAQIIGVRDLSRYLAKTQTRTGVTPFVLYDHNYVLLHPSLDAGNSQQPLKSLNDFDDRILQRIWSPDEQAEFISKALVNTQASGIFRGNDYYLYLYRDITDYGPAPWTIGVYLNTTLLEDKQTENLIRELLAGIAVLVFAIFAAIVVGRRISGPIRQLARAADAIDAGDLESTAPLGSSRIRELDDAAGAFNRMLQGLKERRLIRETLGRFVPEKVASSLLSGGGDIPVQQTEASILFCDIEAFTRLTESLGPVRIVAVLNAYFSAMVEILERHGGVVTQFQGDAILATFNVPIADAGHAGNAFRAACEMLDATAANRYEGVTINIRIGINSGDVVAGAIGARGRLNYTVHGDAVNLAARLEALNKEYGSRLLVSESTARQVDDENLVQIGETTVRGQTHSIRLFSLERYLGTRQTGTGE
jgi:class 3 adenylate cyclase